MKRQLRPVTRPSRCPLIIHRRAPANKSAIDQPSTFHSNKQKIDKWPGVTGPDLLITAHVPVMEQVKHPDSEKAAKREMLMSALARLKVRHLRHDNSRASMVSMQSESCSPPQWPSNHSVCTRQSKWVDMLKRQSVNLSVNCVTSCAEK